MRPMTLTRQRETFCLDDGSNYLVIADQSSLFSSSFCSDVESSLNDDATETSLIGSASFKSRSAKLDLKDDVPFSLRADVGIVCVRRSLGKSDESYVRRRQRNNAAVKRSREKARQRQRESQRRLSELAAENSSLQLKASVLVKELSLLRGLFPTSVESAGSHSNQKLMADVDSMLTAAS